ncbi:MAG: 16S rRNA processing protein RimM [Deltaproteobacteria bacterium]|nr:MAG: 16S rRNA processing protein RimM [Deltaproteobacteria bacterium]
MADDRLLLIGYVARAHGVRGELRVHLHNPESETLYAVATVYLDGEPYAVASARAGTRGAVLLAVDGVADRDRAEALKGAAVAVDRADVPLAPGEVFEVDLIGCAVELVDGTPWGRIEAVIPGAQDRLVIRDGDVERELPLVRGALVVDIDLDRRRVVVDPPEGLPEVRR